MVGAIRDVPNGGCNTGITRFDYGKLARDKKKVSTHKTDDVEPITTELYQVLCYQCGLKIDDLFIMTVGMCLDYIQEYVDHNKPQKEKSKRATQQDFDNF